MKLDVTVDAAPVMHVIRAAREMAFPQANELFGKIGGKFTNYFSRKRMSGRPGLVRRTSNLSGALVHRTTGSNLNSLRTQIGFLNPKAAQIARVHELGTVGKGGTLPDIVPRTKPFLAFTIRDPGAALSANGRLVLAKKVSIPPRLQYFATFYGPFQGEIPGIIAANAAKWAKRAGGGG